MANLALQLLLKRNGKLLRPTMAVRISHCSLRLPTLWSRCTHCSRPIMSVLHNQPPLYTTHNKEFQKPTQLSSCIHTTSTTSVQEKHTPQKALLLARKLFENKPPDALNKDNFKSVVDTFYTFDVRRRGYLQFIDTALKNMKRFGVEKDVDAYNMILDIFPKGRFQPTNFFQAIMNHSPEQQSMGMMVLQQMEDNTVMPNKTTRELIKAVFGQNSHPLKKYQRMMYWFPKFWNLNPFPLPDVMPKEHIKLCELGLKRIAEYEAKLSISYLKGSYPDSHDPEFIATMQSQEQKEMLAEQPINKALYVEGAFTLWLRNVQMSYFILRGDPFSVEGLSSQDQVDEHLTEKQIVDELKEFNISLNDYRMKRRGSITSTHNAPDPIQEGPIFAICMTSNQTEGTLRQWIQTLQEENPHLANIPVYFNLFNLETGKHHMSELIGNQHLIESR